MSQGNWIVDGAKEETCPKCWGTRTMKKIFLEEGEDKDTKVTCDRCGGGGVIEK